MDSLLCREMMTSMFFFVVVVVLCVLNQLNDKSVRSSQQHRTERPIQIRLSVRLSHWLHLPPQCVFTGFVWLWDHLFAMGILFGTNANFLSLNESFYTSKFPLWHPVVSVKIVFQASSTHMFFCLFFFTTFFYLVWPFILMVTKNSLPLRSEDFQKSCFCPFCVNVIFSVQRLFVWRHLLSNSW